MSINNNSSDRKRVILNDDSQVRNALNACAAGLVFYTSEFMVYIVGTQAIEFAVDVPVRFGEKCVRILPAGAGKSTGTKRQHSAKTGI